MSFRCFSVSLEYASSSDKLPAQFLELLFFSSLEKFRKFRNLSLFSLNHVPSLLLNIQNCFIALFTK